MKVHAVGAHITNLSRVSSLKHNVPSDNHSLFTGGGLRGAVPWAAERAVPPGGAVCRAGTVPTRDYSGLSCPCRERPACTVQAGDAGGTARCLQASAGFAPSQGGTA